MMKSLIQRIWAGLRRSAQALVQRLKTLASKLRVFWDRFGYAASMVVLLALVGTAASIYRSRAANPAAPAPTPTATPEPALLSSVNMDAEAVEEEEITFLQPVDGELVGEYRSDELIWSDTLMLWQTHAAIDIAAPLGTAVAASADGTVMEAYKDPLLGYTVRLSHADGYESLYAGLQSAEIAAVGAEVGAGEVIGAVGESADAEADLGAHLHFALYLNGEAVEPPFIAE